MKGIRPSRPIRLIRPIGLGLLLAGAADLPAETARQLSHPPANGDGEQASDAVAYPLEDFETWMPGVWLGRPDVKGFVIPEEDNAHGGKRSARFIWDLTGVKSPDQNFAMLTVHRPMSGRPREVRAWVFTPPEVVGAPLRLWIRDATEEFFIPTVELHEPGWNEIRFPVAGVPASWESGNRDQVQDLPLTLFGFAIEWAGRAGEILVDDITVVAHGDPREFVLCALESDREHFIGWGQPPPCRVRIPNYSPIEHGNLSAWVSAIDAVSEETAWQTRIPIARLQPGETFEACFTPAIRAGAFDLQCTVHDAQGELPSASSTVRMSRMMGDVSALEVGPAERAYKRRWGLPGGVFWLCTPRRAAATGASWERHWTQWLEIERQPGAFDFTKAIEEAKQIRDAGLDVVYFNTIYEQPPFYKADHASFAPAYGRLHQLQARAMGEHIQYYEFGNEDNGPSKFLYTEIARHGSAGVRSESPETLLGNSGTAMVDIGWLRMQAKRGLFDRLDALVTHPYPWTSSPEDYGVLEQLNGVDKVIDELGGMKFQLTTEWGYDHQFDQRKRAEWIPRHFVIGYAAGLLRHGLFAWDNHFGIYDNGHAYPAAVSVNAFCYLTIAHRFAGWLQKDPEVWAAMFERAGEPLLMAWSPSEAGTLVVGHASDTTRVLDLYGNAETITRRDDKLVLQLTGAPVYVTGLSREALRRPLLNTARLARERYTRLLQNSGLRDQGPWREFEGIDSPSVGELSHALLNWNPSSRPVAPAEQAVIAQTLRRLILAAHSDALSEIDTTTRWSDVHGDARTDWSNRLAESVQQDVDLPAVRWVLELWDQVRDEAAMSHERGNDQLALVLSRVEPVFDKVSGVLAEEGPRLFFPVWPYLYRQGDAGAPLIEHLTFIPGKAVPVKTRLLSYASRAYPADVALELPPDWRIEPEVQRMTITPGEPLEVQFMVTAGDTAPREFFATLSVPGKPLVRVPYNDFEILPSFEVSIPVLSSLLPQSSLSLEVTNNGDREQGAKLRLLRQSGDIPLAVVQIESLGPGESRTLDVALPRDLPVPAFHAWPLVVHLRTTDGKASELPATVDFSAMVYAAAPPTIDGDLRDWTTALPLHLDKEAYTHGSFGGGWSREDLSGVAYTMWDAHAFYVAVRVTDQLFQQALENGDVWNEDSVQIALAPEGGGMTEFSLALTPGGPQVWCYQTMTPVRGAELDVAVIPGATLYECAIPWTEISGIAPREGAALRFDVLLNDSDVTGGRKHMERYGMGIVHTKDAADFGTLHVLSRAEQASVVSPAEAPPPRRILADDFEEYADGELPDMWKPVVDREPVPRSVVRAGLGRNGSKALALSNEIGLRPHVYLMIVRKLEGLEAGKRYVLRAWVKGSAVESTGSILGVCSDIYGNEGFQMIPAWEPTDDWQQVECELEAPPGSLNFIIRNSNGVMSDFLIDDLEVVSVDP